MKICPESSRENSNAEWICECGRPTESPLVAHYRRIYGYPKMTYLVAIERENLSEAALLEGTRLGNH